MLCVGLNDHTEGAGLQSRGISRSLCSMGWEENCMESFLASSVILVKLRMLLRTVKQGEYQRTKKTSTGFTQYLNNPFMPLCIVTAGTAFSFVFTCGPNKINCI